jgi:hypothetical protein
MCGVAHPRAIAPVSLEIARNVMVKRAISRVAAGRQIRSGEGGSQIGSSGEEERQDGSDRTELACGQAQIREAFSMKHTGAA